MKMPLPIRKPDALSPQACIPAALPMMTAYKELGFAIADYPNAYARFANEVTLPLYSRLTDEEVNYIIENYQEVVATYM